ncbi:MAG: phosphoglycerate kinase [Candidatus Dadabacteria bacterium]|nr:phosphoglycerate kinase [Candidatus Dadabacteria bacterium]NIQ17133.1 phosphoglycerate kinase [Candidatus Dadabacteria bacterium]
MSKLSITDIPDSEYNGKKVFLRVDFNVPIKDGKIREDYRIRRAIPTIDYLLERKAKVIIASHLGRPKGRKIPSLSLAPVALRLNELLNMEVKFIGEVVGEKVLKAVNELKDGDVMLLENLRFHVEEREDDPEFSKELASLADIYVDDAFGTSHRAHASTHGMAKYFDRRVAGLLVKRELQFLEPLLENPERPYLVIVGGAKIKDKISALKNMMEKADHVLIGGCVAYTFLSAKGVNVGKSLVEEEMVPWAREALQKYGEKIVLPLDHVVAESIEDRRMLMVVDNEIPDDLMGLDIGPKTVTNFVSHIKGNGTVFWNGPMGLFEIDDFSTGTMTVARSVALATWRGAVTVVGGGDSTAALRKAEVLISEIKHVSTGGGASLEFLGGVELPGISVLNDKQT